MKKNILIIISIILTIILVIFLAYLVDMNCMKNNKPVFFSTWGYQYVSPVEIDETINILEDNKNVDEKLAEYDENGDYIVLVIPEDWEYGEAPELNDWYRGGLKIYPKNSENYMSVYFANRFGVCGTGLEVEKINLNNGIEVEVGYYNGNENWEYAYFEDKDTKITALNKGLEREYATNALEILKTVKYNKNK